MRQLVFDPEDAEDSEGRYTKSKKLCVDAAYKRTILGNTSYRYFRYEGGDYYLVGWDASQGYRPDYSFLGGIYRIWSESGTLSEKEWKTFFSLCDVGFVRETSESTVIPAFAKYLREYIRVADWSPDMPGAANT